MTADQARLEAARALMRSASTLAQAAADLLAAPPQAQTDARASAAAGMAEARQVGRREVFGTSGLDRGNIDRTPDARASSSVLATSFRD